MITLWWWEGVSTRATGGAPARRGPWLSCWRGAWTVRRQGTADHHDRDFHRVLVIIRAGDRDLHRVPVAIPSNDHHTAEQLAIIGTSDHHSAGQVVITPRMITTARDRLRSPPTGWAGSLGQAGPAAAGGPPRSAMEPRAGVRRGPGRAGEVVASESLLLAMPVVLGGRFPPDVRSWLVTRIRDHLAPAGSSTEGPTGTSRTGPGGALGRRAQRVRRHVRHGDRRGPSGPRLPGPPAGTCCSTSSR
jgi:hypothetical protein